MSREIHKYNHNHNLTLEASAGCWFFRRRRLCGYYKGARYHAGRQTDKHPLCNIFLAAASPLAPNPHLARAREGWNDVIRLHPRGGGANKVTQALISAWAPFIFFTKEYSSGMIKEKTHRQSYAPCIIICILVYQAEKKSVFLIWMLWNSCCWG